MLHNELKVFYKEDAFKKYCISEKYNFIFNKKNGFFMRWGTSLENDPSYAPSPEILDLEISEICHGLYNKPCKWCYKSNTGKGKNMTFETFQKLFHKLPKSLMQIAFGIGDIDSNPDTFKIMEYCKNNDYNYVVPNITINGWGLTDDLSLKLKDTCGAVSVSCYDPKDICYDAVAKLTSFDLNSELYVNGDNLVLEKHKNMFDLTSYEKMSINKYMAIKNFSEEEKNVFFKKVSQERLFVNIHQLVAEETFEKCLELMGDYKNDPRLRYLNAIVFLILKPKGKRNHFSKISEEKYNQLVKYAMDNKIPVGFDSCSAPRFLNAIKNDPDFKKYESLSEPCESYLFSMYINVEGKTVPCSFLEDIPGYTSLDVLSCNDFIKDIWFHDSVKEFRKKLIATSKNNGLNCRQCPEFDIY